MNHLDIREKFLKFFESRGHKTVPSSSLLPTDPSVLFTTAGMQQFKPYYINPENAPAKNVVSIQKCLRTSDIDEVGDGSHLTFFEMLGNFSFGGYGKGEAIQLAWKFITGELKISKDRIHVTIFDGRPLGRDEESFDIWKKLGLPEEKIKTGGIDDNFWGPTGSEGPCGPTTEIYIDGIEIWNIVFNQYYSSTSREEAYKNGWHLKDLDKPGIDTGMGLERLAMVVQRKNNIFETDLFVSFIKLLPDRLNIHHRRIFADHMRAIAFLIADGVLPSRSDRGSILRKLSRRLTSILFRTKTEVDSEEILKEIVKIYGSQYPELKKSKIDEGFASSILYQEDESFRRSFQSGEKRAEKVKIIDAPFAFLLHQSFGWTYDMIKDFDVDKTQGLTKEAFDKENEKHKIISRAGAKKKFGGHGLLMDTGELKAGNEEELKKATRLHTATHLLHAALRKVLGTEAKQAGSDITAERLRFDFTFPRKMTPEELKQVEDLVNEAVQKDYQVTKEEMSYEDAIKSGAMAFFKLKYPSRVNVYSVGDFSKELCGGPHVSHTAEIGKFKITKEEAISAGVRRIRATVE